MPLANLVVHAAMQAFAEAIGASGTAHTLALGLWVSPPERAVFSGPASLGLGVGVAVAIRARLFPAIAEGARSLPHPRSLVSSPRAREALVIAWICAVSAGAGAGLSRASGIDPWGREPSDATPQAVAIGLGLSGIALLSGALVSLSRDRGSAGVKGRATYEEPSWIAATLAGLASALGARPGASRACAAAAVLLALGVKPLRSMEIALAAMIPFWWFDAARSGAKLGGDALAAALFGFLGAYAGVALLRTLAAKKALAVLSLWMIPLACAIFAYGRAAHARDAAPAIDTTRSSTRLP